MGFGVPSDWGGKAILLISPKIEWPTAENCCRRNTPNAAWQTALPSYRILLQVLHTSTQSSSMPPPRRPHPPQLPDRGDTVMWLRHPRKRVPAVVRRRRGRLHSRTSNCECFRPGSVIMAIWPVSAHAIDPSFNAQQPMQHSTPELAGPADRGDASNSCYASRLA